MNPNNNFSLLLFLFLISSSLLAQQQQSKNYTIPLSNPNATGELRVDLHNGGVTVEGHSGKDVIVTMTTYDSEESSSRSKDGLMRIPNTSLDFEITEHDNVVSIEGSHKGRTDFTVKVPQQFSLSLGTHHNGDILVKNVTGELEIDAHHGGIKMVDVGGSIVADTHHGAIVASLTAVKANTPMAFSTYHGDVDITFPASLNATAKMKSEKGDIFTDFELNPNTPEPKITSSGKAGTKIEISSWIYSDIGKGGPEFMFTTHHGDVILRKRK